MKALPFKIPKTQHNAILFQEDSSTLFYDKLHQHEEIQISCIIKGEGTLLISDTVHPYKQGSVFVIGSWQPHVFRSIYRNGEISNMFSIFFSPSSFGETFFNLSELQKTHAFFEAATYGFQPTIRTDDLVSIFYKMQSASEYDWLILFLELIKLLSVNSKKLLTTGLFTQILSEHEGKRMSEIMDFILTNFHKKLSLEDAVTTANMTKTAFCKYFKNRTNRTFFDFLTEVRIHHAADTLLRYPDLPIQLIAEQCGFNNLSHFNRKFRHYKDTTPSAYRDSQGS